jgi:hypothetical protein
LSAAIDEHSIYALLYCLPIAALLAADDGNGIRAIELYGTAQRFNHISNSRWFADVACRELDEVAAALLPDVAAAALVKGQSLDVWETADLLLLELTA